MVVFPELPGARDMYIDRWSRDLALAGSRTKDEYAWKRAYLKKPTEKKIVQILENDKWYDGTILSSYEKIEDMRPVPYVKLGFRIYCKEG